MLVSRQKRRSPSSAETLICGNAPPSFTMKIVPVSAFSGRPPSCGPKRQSRQVPVHVGMGSVFASSCVSL